MTPGAYLSDAAEEPTGGECGTCGVEIDRGSVRWNGWAWEHKNPNAHPQAGHHLMEPSDDLETTRHAMDRAAPQSPEEAAADGRTVRMEGRGEVDPDALGWETVHKKPVAVEATPMPATFEVETLEGTMEGDTGDVLMRGVEGELYPCDSEIFAKTYLPDDRNVPRYTEADLRAALRELRQDTLEHVPMGVTDTDARRGADALAHLLRDRADPPGGGES